MIGGTGMEGGGGHGGFTWMLRQREKVAGGGLRKIRLFAVWLAAACGGGEEMIV